MVNNWIRICNRGFIYPNVEKYSCCRVRLPRTVSRWWLGPRWNASWWRVPSTGRPRLLCATSWPTFPATCWGFRRSGRPSHIRFAIPSTSRGRRYLTRYENVVNCKELRIMPSYLSLFGNYKKTPYKVIINQKEESSNYLLFSISH